LVAALAATGCDNPACVFGPGNCQQGGGGGGGGGTAGSAVFPADASWLAPGPPLVVGSAPSIVDAHEQSPLVVEFDQSLDAGSLTGAFEVINSLTTASIPLLSPPALVADGRLVVLSPIGQFIAGQTYQLRFSATQAIVDVTGQAFSPGTNPVIFEFGVTATPPMNPRLLYSVPRDDATQVGDLTEIVTVFDRRMSANSFSTNSFVVTIGGQPPMPNPTPQSLQQVEGPVVIPFLQVWTWSQANSGSARVSLGAGSNVRVRLAPMGQPLSSPGGGMLATTDIDFTTANLLAPTSVLKAPGAAPIDAIGGPNLLTGNVLEVTLGAAAGNNEFLDVFVIGGNPANVQALRSAQISVSVPSGSTSVLLDGNTLDLRATNGMARFRDGDIEFMTRSRRGSASTAARRADADPSTAGAQRLLLDLTPPRFLGLGSSGASSAVFTSELGGLTIVGRGDEFIQFARVSTTAGDNHTGPDDRPMTALSSSTGLFVARPVIGLPDVIDLAGPRVTYTVEVFDRALNPAPQVALGTLVQVGAVGPGVLVPGAPITVRVFDTETLQPVAGALVMSHADDAGVLTDLMAATTAPTGLAEVDSAVVGRTLVTVQAMGYDAFTLHGVPSARLDVPLRRRSLGFAMLSGSVLSSFLTDFSTNTNLLADNRVPQPGRSFGPVAGCMLSATGLQRECVFGPLAVRPGRIGLSTFFATDPDVPQIVFPGAPFQFLRGFAISGPQLALASAEVVGGRTLTVDPTSGVDAFSPHLLDISGLVGLGTVEAPVLTVEAFAPGLAGAPTVGVGVPFSISSVQWVVQGALARVAREASNGELVTNGAIEGDLYLRADVVDEFGSRVTARPRFSNSSGSLVPLDVPRLLAPAPGGLSGGASYPVELLDVIPGALGTPGLYRLTLRDLDGLRWQHWIFDPADGVGVRFTVPPVAGLGGVPLTAGPVTALSSAWTWLELDPTRFLWADVERRYQRAAHARSETFTQD